MKPGEQKYTKFGLTSGRMEWRKKGRTRYNVKKISRWMT